MWGVEEWKALGTVLSGSAQGLGVLGGGWYFFAQKRHGAQKPNLSVSMSCERRASNDPDTDWLSITVTLKKLDRGMLALEHVRAWIRDGNNLDEEVPFWGYRLASLSADGRSVDWGRGDGGALNLTAGEESQLAAVTRVATNAACQVGLVIRAFQHGDNLEGQWQASAISLPRERREGPAQPVVRVGNTGNRPGTATNTHAEEIIDVTASRLRKEPPSEARGKLPLPRLAEFVRRWTS